MNVPIKNIPAERVVRDIRAALANRSIVLIGLMGAGKTSVGRRLARRLAMPFVDADSEIELAAGKCISDIFAEHGEAYFRDGERRVIARLLSNSPQVLATGGGAYMDARTRDDIAANGISLWLKADLNLLLKRVKRRNNRPLLQGRDMRAVMTELMDKRYPVYAGADIIVESSDVPHEQIVSRAVTSLRAHLCGLEAAPTLSQDADKNE